MIGTCIQWNPVTLGTEQNGCSTEVVLLHCMSVFETIHLDIKY